MNELAIFAGAGGGMLAGHILGDRTVCAVERDAYAAAILAQRQNDGTLPVFPIWSDICTFDGRPWRGIADCVSGGFPCQDISIAGAGEGLAGARSGLWREFFRIIREVEPGWVRVENSPMLTSRGLTTVLADLASVGFDAEWDVVSASDLGAWHQRERIWIVAAHTDRVRELQRQGCLSHQRGWAGNRPQAHVPKFGRWPPEPGLVRMVHGVPHGVDRIRCLGNAQVPRVAAAAFGMLANRIDI